MNNKIRSGATAVILLLSSVGFAAAADSNASMAPSSLSLTSAQEHTILQSVKKQNVRKEVPPSQFKAAIGQAVPASISLHALPSDATSKIPAVKSYDYAMLQKQVLIVDPKDRKVVEIIHL